MPDNLFLLGCQKGDESPTLRQQREKNKISETNTSLVEEIMNTTKCKEKRSTNKVLGLETQFGELILQHSNPNQPLLQKWWPRPSGDTIMLSCSTGMPILGEVMMTSDPVSGFQPASKVHHLCIADSYEQSGVFEG